MHKRTIDGRRRTAVVLTGTAAAAALMALAAATPAAAEDPPPPDGPTTIPETTIPPDTPTTRDGLTTTSVTGPDTTASTSTMPGGDGPTTTASDPSGAPATTTTAPPPAREDLDCRGGMFMYQHSFLVRDPVLGVRYDDPGSDFWVTFTRIEVVDDHLELAFDTSHYVVDVRFDAGGEPFDRLYSYEDGKPLPTHFEAQLPPGSGTVLRQVMFCHSNARYIGAEPEPPATATSAPQEEIGGTTAPPVSATVGAPVEAADDPGDGGTLPKTGNDVLPVALAGAGLVAAGGGLLLGRRVRRSEA